MRVREFRVLWLADLQSSVGDQLSRVALSVLVYNDTGSGFMTAGVYALSYLPALLGSIFLGHLGDRFPKRGLLITGDVLRAGLLALMAWPRTPLPVTTALLVVVVIIGTPWQAAESALVSEILGPDRYVLGVGLRVAAQQGAQLAGFGVGGIVVAAIGSHSALFVDAISYAISALLIVAGVRRRPVVREVDEDGRRRNWMDGARTAFSTRHLRYLIGFSWLAGLIVAPEGLAAPYADAIGGGAGAVGLLLAANPAGLMIGTIMFTRMLSSEQRARTVGLLAMLSCLPSVFLWGEPPLAVAMMLLALSGLMFAYQSQVMTEFAITIPPGHRGQAISVAAAGLLVAQGIGLVAGGAIAQAWSVGPAIGVCGAVGVVIAWRLTILRAKDLRARRRAGGAPGMEVLTEVLPESSGAATPA
jgi:predicted MFS family arabinose efflux permease